MKAMKTVELMLVFVVPQESDPEEWAVPTIMNMLERDEQLVGYASVEKPGDCRDD